MQGTPVPMPAPALSTTPVSAVPAWFDASAEVPESASSAEAVLVRPSWGAFGQSEPVQHVPGWRSSCRAWRTYLLARLLLRRPVQCPSTHCSSGPDKPVHYQPMVKGNVQTFTVCFAHRKQTTYSQPMQPKNRGTMVLNNAAQLHLCPMLPS
jgi:hypothetical protein